MARHGVPYKALARLMSAGGKEESATALTTRINRGTFTLAFALEAVMKMGIRSLDLNLIALAKERRESRKS